MPGDLLQGILKLTREMRHQYDFAAREHGLTLARARVVTTLAKMDGATQAELAAALEIEQPTLKRQIDALVKAGFIERRSCGEDGRKWLLFLTQRGYAAKVTRFLDNVRAELLVDISSEHQEIASMVVEQLIKNAAKIDRP